MESDQNKNIEDKENNLNTPKKQYKIDDKDNAMSLETMITQKLSSPKSSLPKDENSI